MNSQCLFSGVLWTFGDMTVLRCNNPACQNQSRSHQTEWKVTGRRREPRACLQLSGSCPKQSAKVSRVSSHLITSPSPSVRLYECSRCSLSFLAKLFLASLHLFFSFFDVLEPTLNWADQNVFCVMLKRQKRKNPRNGAKKVNTMIWFGLPYIVETPNLIPTQVHNITIYHCNS